MSYTIVLLSSLGEKNNGANTTDLDFFVNWACLPNDHDYKLTFKLTSRDAGALTSNSQFLVKLLQLGTERNAYSGSDPTKTGHFASSEVIGVVNAISVNNTHFLNANWSDNPSVYVKGRPNNNTLRVQITDFDGTTLYANTTLLWSLILHFEECPKKY